MDTITKPMNKIQKVSHLLKIANELGILNDRMFDDLMDKYENKYSMFDMMFENINDCILNKISIEITKDNFIQLLKIDNYAELFEASYFGKIYTFNKNLDYE